MPDQSLFPKDVKDAESTYRHLVTKGRELRCPHQTQWFHTSAYCKGMRNFIRLNYKQGTVKASYTDAKGRTRFVYEELLAKYAMQKGRLLGMDLSPRVVRRNDSLDGQRDAATVQAVLTHLFPANRVEKLKSSLLQPFLFYGTLGLSLWEDSEDPKEQDIHLIPPWQITPIPTTVTHPTAARGIIVRKRMAIEEIRHKFRNMKMRKGALEKAERVILPRGDVTEDGTDWMYGIDDFMDSYMRNSRSSKKEGADRGKTDTVEAAWLGTVFLWDERNFMTERIIFVDDELLARDSYWQTRTYKQVTTIHDMDVGGFWSRAWMELQIPINSEQEGAIGQTFQNVKNLNMYGITLIPNSFGLNNSKLLTPNSGGPGYMPYEPDGLNPGNQNVTQLRPFTSGNFAVQAMAHGMQISDRMSKQPPMLSGESSGRVDSNAALGTLLESGNTPIVPSSLAIAHGFGQMYQAAASRAMKTFGPEDTIAVTMLDNSMVGVVYDVGRGTIALSDKGVPHPDKVEIGVRSQAPVSKQQQKFELDAQLEKQIIDPTDYRIQARIMNLELPVGNGQEWESYVKARVENVLLFHDGETIPDGSEEQIGVIFSRRADLHQLHIRVHSELVSSLKFSMATQPVRQRILRHLDMHKNDGMGELPDGMGTPEEEAEMALLMEQQQAQMQGGQGAPGGGEPGGF